MQGPEDYLSDWKHLVKNKIEFKINTFESKHIKFKANANMLYSNSIKNLLKELHQEFTKRFIVTPGDKANENAPLIEDANAAV